MRLMIVEVTGDSMRPALRPGDWLVVRRAARVRPGDIIVARHPAEDRLIVKRAVHRAPEAACSWWLESDNQGQGSRDSWYFGEIPEDRIVGRVIARYWPLSRLSAWSRWRGQGRP